MASQDDMLLWLNDRCGREVGAVMRWEEEGEDVVPLLTFVGKLEHTLEAGLALLPDEDPASIAEQAEGIYSVGSVNVQLPLGDVICKTSDHTLTVQVAPAIVLEMIDATQLRARFEGAAS
jgi:hypothetical protein